MVGQFCFWHFLNLRYINQVYNWTLTVLMFPATFFHWILLVVLSKIESNYYPNLKGCCKCTAQHCALYRLSVLFHMPSFLEFVIFPNNIFLFNCIPIIDAQYPTVSFFASWWDGTQDIWGSSLNLSSKHNLCADKQSFYYVMSHIVTISSSAHAHEHVSHLLLKAACQ